MRLALFVCPGCGSSIKAIQTARVFHECPKRKNRETQYERKVVPDVEPSSMP